MAALTIAEACRLLYSKSTTDPLAMTRLNGCVLDMRYDATLAREQHAEFIFGTSSCGEWYRDVEMEMEKLESCRVFESEPEIH